MVEYKKYFQARYLEEDPWRFGVCPYEKIRHAAMGEFVLETKAKQVLDLGCGEGHFIERLVAKEDKTMHITGVEYINKAWERCLGRFKKNNRVRIIKSNLVEYLKRVPAEEMAKFDAVICGDVLYFLPQESVAGSVVPLLFTKMREDTRLIISYADVNNHDWTVDYFLDRFTIARQVYIRPCQTPPPWPWLVTALVRSCK